MKVVGAVMNLPCLILVGYLLWLLYGCDEQIMITVAPNIFALKYSQATDQDQPDVGAKSICYLSSVLSFL